MKTAFVTGVTGHLAREVVDRMTSLGYVVYGVYRDRNSFEKLYKNKDNVHGVECDMNDMQSIHNAVKEINGKVDALDIIITTAAPPLAYSKLSKTPGEKFASDIQVIYIGNAILTLGLLDKLKPGSRIINVLTSAINETPQGMGSYIAAKYALLGFSKSLEKELRSRKIQVICTYPPMMDTPLIRELPAIAKEHAVPPAVVAEAMVPLLGLGTESHPESDTLPKFSDVSIDMEAIERFKLDRTDQFVKKTFSDDEIDYCFSNTQPEMHLAAFFCIKECYIKLTNDYLPFKSIEVRHKASGRPHLALNGLPAEDKFKISITHIKEYSIGIMLRV